VKGVAMDVVLAKTSINLHLALPGIIALIAGV
jgi:hypothetical protein